MEKKRILIVDDEEIVRTLLIRTLKPCDYEIGVAENGIEAINHMDRGSYDLIITDYMMPKMDGLELTRRIRAKYPSTPVLIITGDGPVRDLLRSGATACLEKPFSLFKLRSIVKTILDEEI